MTSGGPRRYQETIAVLTRSVAIAREEIDEIEVLVPKGN